MTIADSAAILDDCHIGDSIAVNGACLTVTEFDKVQHGGWFKVWLANETLERTDLGTLSILRDAQKQRLTPGWNGGHQVSGRSETR